VSDESRAKLKVVALGIALALGGAEIALRLHHRLAAGTPFFSVFPGYRQRSFPLDPFLAFGPRVDWQIEGKQHPETAYFNAQGFRTHETLGARPPGELRIVALGGSTTEDVWNDAGIHWPLIAEQELHARGRTDVRIYNAAMSAYTSAHNLVQLELDVLPYEPNVVLLMQNINDLIVVYAAGALGHPVDGSYHIRYGRKDRTGVTDDSDVVLLRSVDFVRSRLERLRASPPPPPPLERYDLEAGARLFRRNLESFAAVARVHGVLPVFVTEPIARAQEPSEAGDAAERRDPLDRYPPHERFLADFDRYNDVVRETGAALGVAVIDAARRVPADAALFMDTIHTTTAGVRAVGAVVAEDLLPVLPPPPVGAP